MALVTLACQIIERNGQRCVWSITHSADEAVRLLDAHLEQFHQHEVEEGRRDE